MGEYKIIPYSISLEEQVSELMKHLWGAGIDDNLKYLRWKYHNNPHADRPLGIVAFYNEKVVGFRGFLSLKWQTKKGTLIKALSVGDTVVHENHRMKKLSIQMCNRAFDEYKSDYRFLINFSSTQKSLRGYLRLGFHPLIKKEEWVRLMKRTDDQLNYKLEDIETSEKPKSRVMADLVAKTPSKKIMVLQDEDFFEWRFKNNKNDYKFYYYKQNGKITGYMILGAPASAPNFDILDYTENGFAPILKYIIKKKHINDIKIHNVGLSDNVFKGIQELDFKIRYPHKKQINPLFLRPVERDLKKESWFLDGEDMRIINNWKMRWIYSEWG